MPLIPEFSSLGCTKRCGRLASSTLVLRQLRSLPATLSLFKLKSTYNASTLLHHCDQLMSPISVAPSCIYCACPFQILSPSMEYKTARLLHIRAACSQLPRYLGAHKLFGKVSRALFLSSEWQ